jgi:hypothetical protein
MKIVRTIVTYRGKETITMVAAAEVSRSQAKNGIDDSHSCRQKRCLIADAQDIRTSTRTEYEDLHISSSNAGNSFVSTGHFRKAKNKTVCTVVPTHPSFNF